MAFPAFVNSAQGSNYTGATVASIATASVSLTAGNLVIALVRGGVPTSVTDTQGNTYTLRATNGVALHVYSCANCIGGSAVVTAAFSPSGAYVSIVTMQFSGAPTSGEFVNSFATNGVVSGTEIDTAYDTGGFSGSIIVGMADLAGAGSFTFTALTSEVAATGYIEPVADHTSTAFFYRIGDYPITSAGATVRATCNTSGISKNQLVAVFKSTSLGTTDVRITQDVVEALSLPISSLRVSQSIVETLSIDNRPVRVTQSVIELLSEIVVAPPPSTETTQFLIIM